MKAVKFASVRAVSVAFAVFALVCFDATLAAADHHLEEEIEEDFEEWSEDDFAQDDPRPVPITLNVIVDGLQYRADSFVNVILTRSHNGLRLPPQREAVSICDESEEECDSARSMAFKFERVDADVAYVLMLCQTHRRDRDCPRTAKGGIVEVGHIMNVVPTQDSASYLINLEDRY